MKRILSAIIAVALIISMAALFGCSKNPSDDLSSTKPNEKVQEKLDAGMKPLITFVTPVLSDAFIATISDLFQRDFEKQGFSYTVADAQGEMSNMLNLLENAVEMKSSAIIILAFTEGLGDTCAKAEEQGTSIIVFGASPSFEVAGEVVLDMYEQGKQGAYMAHAWLDQVYPNAPDGSVKAMITVNVGQEDNVRRSEAYRTFLPEDPRIDLVYEGPEEANSVDEGFTFAEEAFTMYPDIKVALTFSTSAAMGVNNYIISHFDNLEEFGVFCNSQDESLVALIQASATNDGSCIRGTIAQGGDEPHEAAYQCVLDLLLGGESFGYKKADRTWALDSFGYEYDSEA